MFPLPLTAFEELMLLDRAMSMDIWIEMVFEGQLNPQALQETLDALAARHPLLSCRVEKVRGRRCWVPASSTIPLVRGRSFQSVDAEAGRGILFYLDGSSLFMQVHHACCDGTAVRQILLDLVTHYARATGGPGPEPTRLEPFRLPRRGEIPPPPELEGVVSRRNELLEVLRFLFPWPQALAPEKGTPGSVPFSKRVLDKEQTEAVLRRARRDGGRLQEQAVSDLFAVLGAWQRSHGRRPRSRLRVLIPMDIRGLEDRRMPACNRVTFAFLTRRLEECGRDLSRAIREEHEFIRRYRTDLDFLRGLHWARDRRLLPLILRMPLPLSSAVLTNLGDVTPLRGFPVEDGGVRVGDVLCVHASGATAVRPGTLASFSLCRVAGRLAVGLRCARAVLAWEAEQQLLDAYVQRMLGRA